LAIWPSFLGDMAKAKGTSLRRLYYSISEAAEIAGVPAHVLRYWESEFSELNPRKGSAGARLYQEKDLEVVRRIKTLLYDRKYTIAGARTQLAKRKAKVSDSEALSELKKGLHEILDILDDDTGRGAVR
jgi:DNA-binding transcriptional MerR regulator